MQDLFLMYFQCGVLFFKCFEQNALLFQSVWSDCKSPQIGGQDTTTQAADIGLKMSLATHSLGICCARSFGVFKENDDQHTWQDIFRVLLIPCDKMQIFNKEHHGPIEISFPSTSTAPEKRTHRPRILRGFRLFFVGKTK